MRAIISVISRIKFGSGLVISLHEKNENLALMTTTASAETFGVNLSIFECVYNLNSSGSFVTDFSDFLVATNE